MITFKEKIIETHNSFIIDIKNKLKFYELFIGYIIYMCYNLENWLMYNNKFAEEDKRFISYYYFLINLIKDLLFIDYS